MKISKDKSKINTIDDIGIDRTLEAIINRRCVYCNVGLDENLGRKDWSLPLCRGHYIDYQIKKRDSVMCLDLYGEAEI